MKTLYDSALGLVLTLLLLTSAAAPGVAQVPPGWDAAEFQMTRQDLNDLLARYDSVLASSGYSESLKRDAREASDLIRQRLERGDFRAGDRIVLDVVGETTLPDTVMVEGGPAINLPGMDRISLAGVLRSELEYHLSREIGRYIRDPQITASSLVRLSVQGAVGQPGFHTFPSEMLLSQVLMGAGAPTQSANLEEIRVRRGQSTILEGDEVQTALDEGRSIDQLGLQAGDEITVPAQSQSTLWPRLARYAAIIASTVFLGIRVF